MEEQIENWEVVVPNRIFDGSEIEITFVEGFFKVKGLEGVFTSRKRAEEAYIQKMKTKELLSLRKDLKAKEAAEKLGIAPKGSKKKVEEKIKRCLEKQ